MRVMPVNIMAVAREESKRERERMRVGGKEPGSGK